MYRSSPKLPQWQQRPHRRSLVSRRSRFVLVIGLCMLAWHRYFHDTESLLNKDAGYESKQTYVERGVDLVAHLNLKDREADDITQPDRARVHPGKLGEFRNVVRKSDGVLAPDSDGLLNGQDSRNIADERVSRDPEILLGERSNEASAEAFPHGLNTETHHIKGELDDVPVAGRNQKTKHNPESSQKVIENALPALVMEASQRLIDQHQSPALRTNVAAEVSESSDNTSPPQRFPSYTEYVNLNEKAEALPDIIHVPFEVSTAEVKLQGWEDQWFANAVFVGDHLKEPKIDFLYTWVNGSDTEFQETILPYERNSSLNDAEGEWLESHRVNRYRDWDELRYSIRSVEMYASSFRNRIQLLVNSIADATPIPDQSTGDPVSISGKQKPLWLKDDKYTNEVVQTLSQEDFFEDSVRGCLPTFNSLTIENQIFNTHSDTDRFFALSDDMLLGKPHAAADIYSPLFGPTMGFKTNAYNTVNPPTDVDARRFGEKPFLIYTSWLLNRRFGERKRRGHVHFGHSLSRSVTKEAINSFPRPALQSACQRFRGESGFQLYSWYAAFHYTIERHREALLWSYIMLRSDIDQNGNLGWSERQIVMEDLEHGMTKEGTNGFRKRMFYHMGEALKQAGLQPPKVNVDVQWTSLDGPVTIQNIECFEFNVNECLAPGFSASSSDGPYLNTVFSTASIFDRVARQHPKCGDCLIKLILNRVESGLSPLLPHAQGQSGLRETVIKALWKYQYTVVDPDAQFVMVTDAEQVKNVFRRLVKKKGKVGQLCLNDDVVTEDKKEIEDVREVMMKLMGEMLPEASAYEA